MNLWKIAKLTLFNEWGGVMSAFLTNFALKTNYNLNMEKFLRILILALLPFGAVAQNVIDVKSFTPTQQGDARLYPKTDKNDEDCALIIVSMGNGNLQPGMRFDGAVFVDPNKESPTEGKAYWVYVSPKQGKLTIHNPNHPEWGKKVYTLPFKVEPLTTYRMVLNDIHVTAAVGGKQYLTIKVIPAEATVKVTPDGSTSDMWPVKDGLATQEVDPGTYNVEVSAPDYHTEYSRVVFDGKEPRTETIALRPNFGFLTVMGGDDLQGADFYVDGRKIGSKMPMNHRIKSGRHQLMVSKELYKSHTEDFEITDNNNTTLQLKLTPDFAETTVVCQNPQAEIYRDGKLLGTGRWRGPLKKGNYLFETRLPHHDTYQQQVSVTSITDPVDVTLNGPTPIYGSLSINSTPVGAKIAIDGKDMGVTPRSFHDILEGPHTVTLTMAAHQPKTVKVEVSKNAPITINETLSNSVSASVSVYPSYAHLYVDGKRVETEGGKYEFIAGVGTSHTAKASYYDDYTKGSRSFVISAIGDNHYGISLKEILIKKTCGYFDIGVGFPANIGLDLAFGGYFSGFNVEGNFLWGFNKTKEFTIGVGSDTFNEKFHSYEWGLRIGYGIRCGTRFQLTPQVGIQANVLDSSLRGGFLKKETETTEPGLHGTNTLSGVGALRMYLAFNESLGMSLVPEYRFGMAQSDLAKQMADLDGTFKGFTSGFNCKVNFTITF